jgi:hypothetical protein
MPVRHMSWLRNLTIGIVPNASEAICTALPLRSAGCQFPRVRCVVRQPYDRGFRMYPPRDAPPQAAHDPPGRL